MLVIFKETGMKEISDIENNIQRLAQIAQEQKDDALYDELSDLFPELVQPKAAAPIQELELEQNN